MGGETAAPRQILPGYLRPINHKRAKLRPSTLAGTYPCASTDRTARRWARPHRPRDGLLGTGFSLAGRRAGSAQETRGATAPRRRPNIDALLALQGIEEDPAERRKRSVQRGKGALDVLDDLKIGLLPAISTSLDGKPAARRGRQPEILLRRPGPRFGAVRDRVAGRGRTRQGRAALSGPVKPRPRKGRRAHALRLLTGSCRKLPHCTVCRRRSILSVT